MLALAPLAVVIINLAVLEILIDRLVDQLINRLVDTFLELRHPGTYMNKPGGFYCVNPPKKLVKKHPKLNPF